MVSYAIKYNDIIFVVVVNVHVYMYCNFIVMSTEERENIAMFVDPVNKFFEVHTCCEYFKNKLHCIRYIVLLSLSRKSMMLLEMTKKRQSLLR